MKRKRKCQRKVLKFDVQLPSRLYNLLKDDAYGYVYNSYLTDECPECNAGEKHLGQANDFLLCHKCKKVTAIALM